MHRAPQSSRPTGVRYRTRGWIAPVLDARRANPDLGPRENEWLIRPDNSAITREDLLRMNTSRYVDEVFGDGIEDVLIKL